MDSSSELRRGDDEIDRSSPWWSGAPTSRWVLFALTLVGVAVLAGCSPADESQESQRPSFTSTTEATPPTITGTVTLQSPDDWGLYPLNRPLDQPDDYELQETVYNGDECRSEIVSEARNIGPGRQVIAKDSKGEIIGIGQLGDGSVEGLDSDGFDVPTGTNWVTAGVNLREMRLESGCSFPFTFELTHESPFYLVGIEYGSDPNQQREQTYTHDELESAGWVVSFIIR